MSSAAKSSPKDAQVMSAILKDMGVLESEPRLINQMLEFTYRYVTDVLEDAKVYSSHANRKAVDTDDIKLAVQIKMDHSFTTPPPRDLLMEIARQKNGQPLPLVKPYCGPRLPPDRYCISAPNYKLKSIKKPRNTQYALPVNQRLAHASQVKNLATPALTVVTKTLTQPKVTILSKSAAAPKPTVRVNPGLSAIGASGLSRLISTGGVSSGAASNTQTSVSFVSGASNVSVLPTSSLSSSSLTTLPTSTSILTMPPSATVNPLKRKLEDDDYDI